MGIQVTKAVLKIVVAFNSPNNLTQVTNFWNNTLKPALATIITTKINTGFKAGFTFNKADRVTLRPDGKYEVYGKLIFTGEAKDGVTKQQLLTGIDEMFDDMKVEYKSALATASATNVLFHIHRSTGASNET